MIISERNILVQNGVGIHNKTIAKANIPNRDIASILSMVNINRIDFNFSNETKLIQ